MMPIPAPMETSCGFVLVNYDSVLLLQYPQGHWDLPKGHVETTDVDYIATVRRELAEETGITDLVLMKILLNAQPIPIDTKVANETKKSSGSWRKRKRSM